MTKAELIKEISLKTQTDKAQVEVIVDSLMSSLRDSLLRKEGVSLRGFGNFILKRKAAKKARNISKNISIDLPAYYKPAFRPSPKFFKKVKALKVD